MQPVAQLSFVVRREMADVPLLFQFGLVPKRIVRERINRSGLAVGTHLRIFLGRYDRGLSLGDINGRRRSRTTVAGCFRRRFRNPRRRRFDEGRLRRNGTEVFIRHPRGLRFPARVMNPRCDRSLATSGRVVIQLGAILPPLLSARSRWSSQRTHRRPCGGDQIANHRWRCPRLIFRPQDQESSPFHAAQPTVHTAPETSPFPRGIGRCRNAGCGST